MINVLAWIVLGALAGWLASLVVRGTGLGVVADMLVGIIGAIIGGLVLSLLLPGAFGIAALNLGSHRHFDRRRRSQCLASASTSRIRDSRCGA